MQAGGLAVRRCQRPVRFAYAYARSPPPTTLSLPPHLSFSFRSRRLQLLRSVSRMGVRGPEQGNLYSKRRYEPGLCRSPHITFGRTEIRRRAAGVLNYPRSLLEETRETESRASGVSCVSLLSILRLLDDRLFFGRSRKGELEILRRNRTQRVVQKRARVSLRLAEK